MATVWEIISQSALLILILLALRPVFKKHVSARFRYALWLLPVIRLLVPFSAQSVMSIWNMVKPEVSSGLTAAGNSGMAQTLPGITVLPPSQAALTAAGQTLQSTSPILDAAASTVQTAPLHWAQLLPSIGMAVWVLGGIAFLLMLAANNIRLAKRLRGARRVPADVKVPVLLADALPSPCLTGFWRPRIVITPEVFASNALLDMVLRHEWTHYRRHDHLWTAVRGMLLCAWWWNPLVWLAARLSREDCEAACDEAVISHMAPEDRQRYGMSLIALLGKNPYAQSLMQTTTAMQGSKRAMKERITMIANWKSKGRMITICAALCVALLVPVLCTSAVGQGTANAQTPEPGNTSDAAAIQEEKNEGHTANISLEKAAAYREDEFLFAGRDSELIRRAILLCADQDGQTKWAVQEDAGAASKYNTAIPYEDDKYIAVRYIVSPSDTYYSVIELIQNGSILGQIERPYVIQGIFPAEQGFLEISKPSMISTTIKKVDFEHGLIWQKTYQEDWFLDQVVTVSDGYIAIGSHTADNFAEDSTVGVVMKLDRNGDTVWKHYYRQKSDFRSGISVFDSSAVLVGNAYASANTLLREKDQRTYSFIAMYDERGLVWQTEYRFGGGKNGHMESIIQVEDGFLASCEASEPYGPSEVRLLLFDRQGNIVKEWVEPMGDMSRIYIPVLHHTPKGIYLTAGGKVPGGKWQTVMKKINLPADESTDSGEAVTQLTVLNKYSRTAAQISQTGPYRGMPDEEIEQLIAKWNEEYKDADSWNLEKKVRDDTTKHIHGLPDEGMITHLNAIHILLEYIKREYSDVPFEDIACLKPHISFIIDYEFPQWQIDLMPPDTNLEMFGFTGYIYADTGDVRYVVHGPGNG